MGVKPNPSNAGWRGGSFDLSLGPALQVQACDILCLLEEDLPTLFEPALEPFRIMHAVSMTVRDEKIITERLIDNALKKPFTDVVV
jgi:hypothetical protein